MLLQPHEKMASQQPIGELKLIKRVTPNSITINIVVIVQFVDGETETNKEPSFQGRALISPCPRAESFGDWACGLWL